MFRSVSHAQVEYQHLPRDWASRSRLGRHQRTTGLMCGLLANALGMDADDCKLIVKAAALHDIGKLYVPSAILDKPGKLNDQEIEFMRLHPQLGSTFLNSSPRSRLTEMAAVIALEHHERWDGRGYPFAKRGSDIALPSRIAAMGDVYSALRERRAYKLGMDHDAAMRVILSERDSPDRLQFDPDVVDALVTCEDAVRNLFESRGTIST